MIMNKNYTSTRDNQVQLPAKAAIRKGFSDDGGLFVYPELSKVKAELSQLVHKKYQESAIIILKKLLPDFAEMQIEECIKNAYNHSFDTSVIPPIRQVDNFKVLELFHGPASAFK